MQKLILLIDDDEDELFFLQQAVEQARLPFLCAWAESADHAWRLLQQLVPDLILIDYNMPQTNGVACLQQIRSMFKLREVPVVMYSNHISYVTRELALTSGATCLQKPNSVSQLVQYLTKFFVTRERIAPK